jgi:polyisoprenoid-binding protein YceI
MRQGPANPWRNRICPALLALVVFLACPTGHAVAAGNADAEQLTLDPARSHADFEVKVLWLIGVHGRFGQVRGEVLLDRSRGTLIADARIDVENVTMRNRSYADWVKSDEFFDARRFPLIHFVSAPVPLERLRSGGEISGTLSLRGIDQPVLLQLDASACPDAIATACPVEARGTIRRSDFGMRSRRGTLSDKVELAFSIYLSAALPEAGRGQ